MATINLTPDEYLGNDGDDFAGLNLPSTAQVVASEIRHSMRMAGLAGYSVSVVWSQTHGEMIDIRIDHMDDDGDVVERVLDRVRQSNGWQPVKA